MGLLSRLIPSRWFSPRATVLDAEALTAQARGLTGLDDLGDEAYVPHLEALIASARNDGLLHARGLAMMGATLSACLQQRLRFVEAQRKAGTAAHLAARPLVVAGLPRSGTTLLHRMLAADPQARALPLWLCLDPWPPPSAAEVAGDEDPTGRRARAAAAVAATPDVMHIHEMGPELAEECTQLMRTAFDTLQFAFTRPVLSYQQGWFERDHHAAYQHFREGLALLEHGMPQRHWALKSPQHLGALDVLLETFPDADVVCLHRDPVQVVASWCSLTFNLWRPHTAAVDAPQAGAAAMDLLTALCARGQSARRGNPRVLNVGFSSLVADPLGVAQSIYAHFGRPFDEATRLAFATYLAENPRGKRGRHSYALKDFGLSQDQVELRFSDYRDELADLGEMAASQAGGA